MPSFLRAANYPQDFDAVGPAFFTDEAGFFDPGYVAGGLRCNSQDDNSGFVSPGSAPTIVLEEDVADLWVQFRLTINSAANSSGVENVQIRDASSTLVASLVKTSSTTLAARVYGGSTVSGAGFALNLTGSANVLTLRLETTATDRILTAYLGGVEVSSATTSLGSLGQARQCVFWQPWNFTSSSGRYDVFSEFLFSDGIDLRDLRVAALRPTTVGHYSEMEGVVDSLSEESRISGVYSDAAGQRFSWNPEAYGGEPSPLSVRAVIASAGVARFGGEPSRLAQSLRIGSTDYDGDFRPIPPVGTISHVWDVNPATSGGWSVADLADLQVGLVSADT